MKENIKTAVVASFILVFSLVLNTDNDISKVLLEKATYLIGDLKFYEDTAIKVSMNFTDTFSSKDYQSPLKDPIVTSKFGNRVHPITLKPSFHTGLDITSTLSHEVYAIRDGFVLESGYDDNLGNYIILEHSDGYKSLYAHLSSFSDCTIYKKGEVIGYMGDTGKTTGVHLHIEISKDNELLNPLMELSIYEN